jgi:hypothetical protein
MPRHESVTERFVGELRAGFLAEAERVKDAPDWPETQKRMASGTYAYLVATSRLDEGWTQYDIAQELGIRAGFGKTPGQINLTGDEKRDEI